jgi:molybdopterin-guanine dinucleotide biosynthesis protein A
MGRDKGLLDFGGVPLVLHTARLLEPLVAEVTIVGSPSRYASLGLRTLTDENHTQSHDRRDEPGIGPLAGIATALSTTRLPWNLIVACDLPYLSAKWVEWLLSRALHSRREAMVPRTGHGIEPLAAVYRRECGPRIVAALAQGVRKVSVAIEELRVDFVYPREWRHAEPNKMILQNMNAPGDYEEARQWWSTQCSDEVAHVSKPQPRARGKQRSVPRRRK